MLSYRILKGFSVSDTIALTAFEHHERLDGTGYPRALAGEKITLYSRILAVATEGDREIARLTDHVLYVPDTLEPLQPLLTVVPLQLLAYHAAVLRGCNVDKPRNLAKSVTVE
jgi:hypothetical protein